MGTSFEENNFQGLGGPFGPNPLKGYISRLQPDVRAVKNWPRPWQRLHDEYGCTLFLKPDLLD